MKNRIENKRSAWAEKKYAKRTNRMLMGLASIMLVFMLTVGSGLYAEGSLSFDNWQTTAASGVTTATVMGAVGSIDRVPNSQRTGKAIKDKLFILSEDQVNESATFPSRVGIEIGNIPLKAGEYWHYIKSIIDSPEAKSTGAEGDNASTITNEITFVVGGMPDSIIKLLENGIGEAFYVVWEKCATGDKWLGGNPCKPLKLVSFEGGSTKDFTGYTITFKNETGILYSKYEGNTPVAAASVVAADATTIALSTSETYQLTDGSAAVVSLTSFTAVTDADVGRIVTLLGCITTPTYPTEITVAATDFLLVDGETWSAGTNNAISFKIFKDDAASYKFVEIAGSRI